MLWRGLVELCPENAADFPDDMVGAFVLVAGHAPSSADFIERVKTECNVRQLIVMKIDDIADDTTDDDLEDFMLEELRAGTSAIVMGTFHMYPADG